MRDGMAGDISTRLRAADRRSEKESLDQVVMLGTIVPAGFD